MSYNSTKYKIFQESSVNRMFISHLINAHNTNRRVCSNCKHAPSPSYHLSDDDIEETYQYGDLFFHHCIAMSKRRMAG